MDVVFVEKLEGFGGGGVGLLAEEENAVNAMRRVRLASDSFHVSKGKKEIEGKGTNSNANAKG